LERISQSLAENRANKKLRIRQDEGDSPETEIRIPASGVAQKNGYISKNFFFRFKGDGKGYQHTKIYVQHPRDGNFLLKVSVDNLLEKGIYLLENLNGC
jgi:hypothetical protein